MKRLAVLLVVAALAGCRTREIPTPAPAAVHGMVEGVAAFPSGASVQVYRIDDLGLPTPDPFETATLDAHGKFATRVLSPGRFRVVYRSGEGPPSMTTAFVPRETDVVLRPLPVARLVELRARSVGDGVRCRLTECKPPDGIPDIREFRCSADDAARLRGIRRGRWTLDLPELGATTEVDVTGDADTRELVVDPPAAAPGGVVAGSLRKIDGSAAAWMVVSVRPLAASGTSAARWGRYAPTDRGGGYKVVGIPPGPALVRVECRDAPARILPAPHIVQIPPSGTVELGFVVEP